MSMRAAGIVEDLRWPKALGMHLGWRERVMADRMWLDGIPASRKWVEGRFWGRTTLSVTHGL
jgi:hypothetical protein